MLKKALYFSIIVISLFFLKSQVAYSLGPVVNELWGWIWTESYGWISLNRYNCDPDRDGITEGPNENEGNYPDDYRPYCPVGQPVTDYKVRIDETACYFDYCNVTGYAWSENLGWIDFDPIGPYPIGSDTFIQNNKSVNFLRTTGDFFGFARVCSVFQSGCSGALIDASQRGNWDGFIKFNNEPPAPVPFRVKAYFLEAYPSYPYAIYRVNGWAWSADQSPISYGIGWLSFDCISAGTSCLPLPYYQAYLMRISEANSKPYAESLLIDGAPTYCNIGPGRGQVRFRWTYQDLDGDVQNQYNIQVDDNSDFSSTIIDYTAYQTVNPGWVGTSAVIVVTGSPTQGALEVGYRSQLYWRISVKAAAGDLNWSDWVVYNDVSDSDGDGNPQTFTTPPRAYPYPDFTYVPENPKVDEEVTFTNLSKCYDISDTEYACSDLGYMLHEWNFGDGSPLEYDPLDPIAHTYMDEGNYTVGLRVTNTNNPITESCLEEKPLKARLPAPGWKETAPF